MEATVAASAVAVAVAVAEAAASARQRIWRLQIETRKKQIKSKKGKKRVAYSQ
jgi:hypothetical protein